eukprot:scaffold36730_cov18-Tisochrysis_lutea.AAC.2
MLALCVCGVSSQAKNLSTVMLTWQDVRRHTDCALVWHSFSGKNVGSCPCFEPHRDGGAGLQNYWAAAGMAAADAAQGKSRHFVKVTRFGLLMQLSDAADENM